MMVPVVRGGGGSRMRLQEPPEDLQAKEELVARQQGKLCACAYWRVMTHEVWIFSACALLDEPFHS